MFLSTTVREAVGQMEENVSLEIGKDPSYSSASRREAESGWPVRVEEKDKLIFNGYGMSILQDRAGFRKIVAQSCPHIPCDRITHRVAKMVCMILPQA